MTDIKTGLHGRWEVIVFLLFVLEEFIMTGSLFDWK